MPPSLYTRTFDLYKRAEKIVKIIPKTAKITNETIASIVDAVSVAKRTGIMYDEISGIKGSHFHHDILWIIRPKRNADHITD